MLTRRHAVILSLFALAACGGAGRKASVSHADLHPGETPEMRALVRKWAAIHEIPESLLHRQIRKESGYNAAARNGPYYGLLQILPQTARTIKPERRAQEAYEAQYRRYVQIYPAIKEIYR